MKPAKGQMSTLSSISFNALPGLTNLRTSLGYQFINKYLVPMTIHLSSKSYLFLFTEEKSNQAFGQI